MIEVKKHQREKPHVGRVLRQMSERALEKKIRGVNPLKKIDREETGEEFTVEGIILWEGAGRLSWKIKSEKEMRTRFKTP